MSVRKQKPSLFGKFEDVTAAMTKPAVTQQEKRGKLEKGTAAQPHSRTAAQPQEVED